MSRLSELLRQVALKDERLAADLKRETDAHAERRAFGLNFERHVPEAVELPGRRVRKNDKVRCLPARGEALTAENERLWRVDSVYTEDGQRWANIVSMDETADEWSVVVDDLVVVAEFRDPIYPGLVSTGRREHGDPAKPYHAVVNAENYHALQALMFTHRAGVDVIYIDPPYNTGNNGWIYNDKYIASDDLYKHSKWLAFMERRLLLAKELLKPSGVIMVSIGDEEQPRLRLLMDQVFDSQNQVAQLAVEMSTTSGPKTTNAQQGTIVKNVEYVLIYRRSAAFDTEVRHTPLYDGIDRWDANYPLWLNDDGTTESLYDRLDAEPSVRVDIERFGLTVAFGTKAGRFVGAPTMDVLLATSEAARTFIGENLHRIGRTDTPPVSGRSVDVPAGRWVHHQTEGRDYRLMKSSSGKVWQIYTLDRNYRLSDDYVPRFGRTVIRGDLWRGFHSDMGHVSSEGGVGFANGKKPIRLIRQLVRWANNSPTAVILDFFGGSGSTAHAVAEMNAADGGERRSILVTNNELGKTDRDAARVGGNRPGDPEWEALGVYEARAVPRLNNAFSETEANAEFFTLTYEAPLRVSTNREFAKVAPFLWLRAGSRGRRIDDISSGWDVAEAYGVIADLDQSQQFLKAMEDTPSVTLAFIVTDEDRLFEAMVRQLPPLVEPVRLYEAYLRNFEIEAGRATR
ncbi:adenine-specific DNA-methyltransferase [Krasilnikovia cinnamomea]|uniref:Adenine-specific DNA-methyltransferase n=1 Tax=Krasilnikovia cinnamomea TaxID=349313 RepID=A0A4V2G6H5_9ACTN|nr:site-specific DNA-methyltransferase [Krasilnikovia cinnamomea]RZU48736.1 adenine-specific DNA-methyltransferase [Krasilnikovia cinnamomea]